MEPDFGLQTVGRFPSTVSVAVDLKLTILPSGPVASRIMSSGTVTIGGVVSTGNVVSWTVFKNGLVSMGDFVIGIVGIADSPLTTINADRSKNTTKMKAMVKPATDKDNIEFNTASRIFLYITVVLLR
jgi:hypothetical protein